MAVLNFGSYNLLAVWIVSLTTCLLKVLIFVIF